MSNVIERYELGAMVYHNGERVKKDVEIRQFTKDSGGNVGNSLAFTAIAMYPDRRIFGDLIVPHQKIYFKANSQVGTNENGRSVIDEERGSGEDIAEVLAYHLLDDLRNTYPGEIVIEPTPYIFAEFENEVFASIIKKQSDGLIDGVYSSIYGCISPNILEYGADAIHGADILSTLGGDIQAHAMMSKNNTIYNYAKALEQIQSKRVLVSPEIPRQLASLMFFSYFYCDTDKHCQNIVLQSVPLKNGRSVIKCTKILDNGGGMLMQSMNCKNFYREQAQLIQQDGEITEYQNEIRNPFHVQYDLTVGKEIFSNPEIQNAYDKLSFEEQLVLLISQNRILFNDFRRFYEGLNIENALRRLRASTGKNFLPELEIVLPHVFYYKRKYISQVMAQMLGEEFDEEKFKSNPSYYLDKFEGVVLEDALTIKIASNEEIEMFSDKCKPLEKNVKTNGE